MLISFHPLKKYRNFRYLYLGQLVSTFGSMITYVALPYQIYQLTHSSLAVGMIGVVELIPLLVTALMGGHYADSFDRKKLLVFSEIGMSVGSLALVLNSISSEPKLWLIYCIAAFMSAVNGFHRPALESLAPRLVHRDDLPNLSSLATFKGLLGTIAGPALGGFLIASFGISFTFLIDFFTFLFSLWALSMLQLPPSLISKRTQISPIEGIEQGFRYAWSRPELIGSYSIDFIAMIFGMPLALFPAISESFGGAKVVGLLYAAPSAGAMIATIFSGWTKNVHESGKAISLSALVWGLGITAFGFSSHLWIAVPFLMIAGAADAMSGVFRMTLWNKTIPDTLRGRLAGLEMISYMSGPLLGNAEAGLVAAGFGTQASVVSGGILCIIGVFVCAIFLPRFWRYNMPTSLPEEPQTT